MNTSSNSPSPGASVTEQLELLTDPVRPLDIDATWKRGRRSRMNQRMAGSFGMLSFVAILGFMAFNVVDARITPTTTAQTAAEPGAQRTNGPVVGDHWHAAFGVNVCGTWMPDLMSTIDEYGIHSHQDGLIHIHPWAENAAEENATLDVFFETMQIAVTNDGITWDDGTFFSADSACGTGTESHIRMYRFTAPLMDTASHDVTFSDFGTERFLTDRQGFALVIGPEDMPIEMPPSRETLDQVSPIIDGVPLGPALGEFPPAGSDEVVEGFVADAMEQGGFVGTELKAWGFQVTTLEEAAAGAETLAAITQAHDNGVDILIAKMDPDAPAVTGSDNATRTASQTLMLAWGTIRTPGSVLIIDEGTKRQVLAPDLSPSQGVALQAAEAHGPALVAEVVALVEAQRNMVDAAVDEETVRPPHEQPWGFIASSIDQLGGSQQIQTALDVAHDQGVDIIWYAADTDEFSVMSQDGIVRTIEEDAQWRWTQTRPPGTVFVVAWPDGTSVVSAPDLSPERLAALNVSSAQGTGLVTEVTAAVLSQG